jgi:Fe-S-cluster containining protein
VRLRFDAGQRFSCRSCGRCCRGWDVVLTPEEVEALRSPRFARLFRETGAEKEGAERDVTEGAAGGQIHIRRRADGACGFLSRDNRCRIHEALGPEHKPLACRIFPFRFHPANGAPVATASFCCPSVAANVGVPLADQTADLGRLCRQQFRVHGAACAPLELVAGHPIEEGALSTVRSVLREMLDRAGADGSPDLRANASRMAQALDDWTRRRVLRLAPERSAEYLELTGRHAAATSQPVTIRRPSALTRLLSRGFLFVVAASGLQTADGKPRGLRLPLRWRLARLLLHFHGLWPGVAGWDLRVARRARVELADPAVRATVHNYLRATIETLGTGQRPVVDEIGVAVAFLNAALAIAAMRAAQAGAAAVDADRLTAALSEAVHLTHAASDGPLGSWLASLAAGPEALRVFAWVGYHEGHAAESGRDGGESCSTGSAELGRPALNRAHGASLRRGFAGGAQHALADTRSGHERRRRPDRRQLL